MDWEVDAPSQKRIDAIAKAVTKGGKLYPRHRPGSRGRGDLLARARHPGAQEGAAGRRREAGHLQRHHQAVGARRGRPSARPRPAADRRLSGPPRARLSGGLHALARAVAQAAGQPLGRPRPVGGAAPDLRARGRDRGLQDPRILDGRRAVRHRQEADAEGPPHPSRRPQARQVRPRHPGARRAGQARDRAPRLRRRRRSTAARCAATRRRPSSPRPCSRKPRASSASAPPPPCASPSASTRASISAARRSA